MLAGQGAPAHADKRPFPVELSHLNPAGCTLTPIAAGGCPVSTIGAWFNSRSAATLVCRSPPTSFEHWLEQQVDHLRAEAPQATVRLSRLTQGAPGADLEIGWLIELELAEDEPLLAGHRLADALRDMRLLGLQPTLLAPRDAWTNGRAA